jgi:hypothetical protein
MTSSLEWTGAAEDMPCGCCEMNDYDPAPPGAQEVEGSCLNCGHSPEEHED